MIKFLVIGLEASCTRYVSQTIATNAGIIKHRGEWDGHDQVSNDFFSVTHRSFPHGRITSDEPRDMFIDLEYAKQFDHVIFVTRDWHCSLASKIKVQQPSKKNALIEHGNGIQKLKELFVSLKNISIFSYETAFLFQESYVSLFLESIGLKMTHFVKIEDINEKHFNLGKLVMEYLKNEQ